MLIIKSPDPDLQKRRRGESGIWEAPPKSGYNSVKISLWCCRRHHERTSWPKCMTWSNCTDDITNMMENSGHQAVTHSVTFFRAPVFEFSIAIEITGRPSLTSSKMSSQRRLQISLGRSSPAKMSPAKANVEKISKTLRYVFTKLKQRKAVKALCEKSKSV